MLQFTRQLERAQVAQLQLKQELAAQQVQAQLRIAQVGETAHRDIAQLTQSNDMLTAASTHLAVNIRRALDTAEGVAGMAETLKKSPGCCQHQACCGHDRRHRRCGQLLQRW